MKKILVVSLALAFSVGSIAQNDQIQNKKGQDMMPVSGEFAIGMNAVPFLTYIGDVFGLTSNNDNMQGNKFVSYFAGNTLFGKYMLTDNTAIRAHFRVGQFNNVYENMVFDDAFTSPDDLVNDTYTTRSSFYNFGLGYEWRRGKTRLRGIYGGEVFYQFQRGSSTDYTYGNGYGLGNPAPTATSWFSWGGIAGEGAVAERIVSSTGGNYNGMGLRAFAGVEYYIAPRICVGTEFGWGISMGKTNDSSTRTEFWDPTGGTAGTGETVWREITTSGNKGIAIDTDNFGGSLYLMFYF